MPTATIDGLEIAYEVLGSGTPIVWLQGARSPRHLMRPIAEPLSKNYRCLIYDRRNCGESGIRIAGDKSEQEIWVDELAALLKELDLAPAYLGGWSAGCRVALLTAIRYPEVVRGLLLGWVTGGHDAAQRLAHEYYGQFIEAARQGGMDAVTKMPFFADRIKANPANEQRLLGMDPERFIETMSGWERYFSEAGDLPVIGATEAELAGINVPTCIVAGDDAVHPTKAAQELHRILPDSEYHAPPIPRAEFDAFPSNEERDRVRAERTLDTFTAFLTKVESGRATV
ncbi:MAG TPA: alpha/beta hydrolase [Dehalococcoidia bacterium]|nr:alpha/beta hydrolase [Dehalococcoidia bacterium]